MTKASNNITQNMATMKPNEFIDTMFTLMQNCSDSTEMPAILLHGSPGIAKSASIHQIGEKLGKALNKQVKVHDVRLILFNPVDLRGLPSKASVKQKVKKSYNVEGKTGYKLVEEDIDVARWLRPEIFQMSDDDNIINILFLDEIGSAPQAVQAAAYQLVLDRRVGEHRLPNNCFIFAATNLLTDKAVTVKLSSALANRLLHIHIQCDIDDWKKWAINHNIDSRIIGFLNWKPEMLFKFDPSSNDYAWPSPRTWEMTSGILNKVKNIKIATNLISGLIGLGAATEFAAYTKVYHALPNIDAIFEGKEVEYPKEMDVAYAVSSSLVSKANKANKKQIDNMIRWLINWRTDYAVLTAKDCVKNLKVRDMFSSSKAWVEFFEKHKDVVSIYN